MTIIIPAYNPDEHLINLLKDIKKVLNYDILIVNDGSKKECNEIFDEANKYTKILIHEVNKGKGAAMKTAMKYIYENKKEENGFIFVDADYQHLPKDIKKVIDTFNKNKDKLIIGSRFESFKDVPIKSKIGNKITRYIFYKYTGLKISDTQSGLRALNTKYIPLLLEIEGDRYEYEMNMLIKLANENIETKEVSIETVYEDKENSTSHFNPVQDSLKIYKLFFKYIKSFTISIIFQYILFFVLLNFLDITRTNITSNLLKILIFLFFNKIIFKDKNYNETNNYIIGELILIIISTLIFKPLQNYIIFIKPLFDIIMFSITYSLTQFLFKGGKIWH